MSGDPRMLEAVPLVTTPGWEEQIGEHLARLRRRGAVYSAVDENGAAVILVTGYDATRQALGAQEDPQIR